jgi:hypothetical protein
MEKYGVVTDDEKVKTGSETRHCPECGRTLDPSTPNYCEDCGTRPFEKQPPKEK